MNNITIPKFLRSDLSIFLGFFISGVAIFLLFNWFQSAPKSVSGDYRQFFPHEQSRIIAYTKESCPYCVLLKDYFNKNNIAYVERDIEKDSDAEAEYQQLGGYGTPLVLFRDNLIVGFRRELIAAEIAKHIPHDDTENSAMQAPL
ncbi:glutaredoxin family protein [Shewanella salipaludis]|uniref:Glutaredoxin family protein n=1 Tax=Shewanella salipaludis TaxID=2723052 RepID=A0A972JKR1_9GAMM|nr:glutaredoxin family protein [Shewanella salipaludis]NMH66470.1 glutaredoxin family protein [Shewanella salipaludis]